MFSLNKEVLIFMRRVWKDEGVNDSNIVVENMSQVTFHIPESDLEILTETSKNNSMLYPTTSHLIKDYFDKGLQWLKTEKTISNEFEENDMIMIPFSLWLLEYNHLLLKKAYKHHKKQFNDINHMLRVFIKNGIS